MRLLASITLAAASWIDYFESSIRIASGLAALVVAYFAIQAYRSKKKLTDKQYQDLIKQNGHGKHL